MRTRAAGFTLIELMVSVAIIGILASIAIPSFQNMQLRSRQSERTIVMTSIKRAIDEYRAREGRFPQAFGNWSMLNLNDNPDWNPGTQKRPFRNNGWGWDDWARLSLLVEGNVYYSYWGWGWEQPGQSQMWIAGYGDLDGDNIQDQLQKYWQFTGTRLQKFAGWTCNDCSQEWRSPWPNGAF